MKIEILGHCYRAGQHNKIWGVVASESLGQPALVFWGRANGTMSFKWHPDIHSAFDLWLEKKRRGYVPQGPERWSALLPDDFQGQVMLAQLGQVRYDLPENG
jgi:hypothetical protein